MTTTPSKYGNPSKMCDLVMKGGLTSGVVYPAAVLKLAKDHRFIQIGGTSAGAIAAAITAAAEFGRESRSPGGAGGFEGLDALRVELQGEHFIRGLFQPTPGIGPLMDCLLDLVGGKKQQWKSGWAAFALRTVQFSSRLTSILLRRDPLPFAISLLPLAIALYVSWAGAVAVNPWLLIGCVIVGWVLGLVGCVIHLALILFFKVPDNYYGICRGLRSQASKPAALTEWMHDSLNRLAQKQGREPLTFKDLLEKKVNGKASPITLRLVTTNLSHNQPYLLPFLDAYGFMFKEDEMRDFFPKEVVDYMVTHAMQSSTWSLAKLNAQLGNGKGYHVLPSGAELPVVVGMRLSLSFPILISAVPLYTVSGAALQCKAPECVYELNQKHLQRHLFSDGGISSNFPIHFFDAWLPSRPTFGINLTSLPKEAFSAPAAAPNAPVPAGAARAPADVGDRISIAYLSAVQPLHADALAGGEYDIGEAPALMGKQQAAATGPASAPHANGVAATVRDAAGLVSGTHERALETAVLGGEDELLAPRQQQRVNASRDVTSAVYLPTPFDIVFPAWHEVKNLGGFLGAILTTALNYRDNTQSRLRGYRERIVHIRLSEDEGGLNLDMGRNVLQRIDDKGDEAGQTLCDEFNFKYHQWVRFRVLMAELEGKMSELDALLKNADQNSYDALLRDQVNVSYPFTKDAVWRTEAIARLDKLRRHLEDAWGHDPFFAGEDIEHDSILRITPNL
jgi:predicted acylesterase/phospholipase RssA